MHLATATHNPLKERKIISPGIRFPSVRGVETPTVVPVTDVFDRAQLEVLGFETNSSLISQISQLSTTTTAESHSTENNDSNAINSNTGQVRVVDNIIQLSESSSTLTRITAPSESFCHWRHVSMI